MGLLDKLFPWRRKRETIAKNRTGVEGRTGERRKFKRFKANIIVLSKFIPGFRTVTRDISLGGMRIVLPAPLPQGSELELELDLDSKFGRKTMKVKAKVVWVRQVAPRRYEAGLKFLNLSERKKDIMISFLKEISMRKDIWTQKDIRRLR